MEIKIPELSLVVLVGVSGSGKSTFARRFFKNTEILSSDTCRAWVSDDENNQAATNDAFEVLHYITAKRLKNGLLTVIDATNVQKDARKALLELARTYHCLPVAIVLDLPAETCVQRNDVRPDRHFGAHVVHQQAVQLRKARKTLKEEGFRYIYTFESEAEINAVTGISREKLYNDKKSEKGPFDIIGDIHGCMDELCDLLALLGYTVQRVPESGQNYGFEVTPPAGRRAVFVGDLVDRGPDSVGVLRLVMSMVYAGTAFCVPGNHDDKLKRFLGGKAVKLRHGLETTVAQLEQESPAFKTDLEDFLKGLISHYVFDGGRLVVAHAGVREEMQGRGSGVVRAFCMYGETTGEIDEFGLPVRYNWAKEYRGKAKVVYGHTPVLEAEWLNRTIDIDTGCVFGGKLTALRYPEETLVSVPARMEYYKPARPLLAQPMAGSSAQQEQDELLDLEEVTGKRILQTRLRANILLHAEQNAAALELMSRFAVNPKWLLYLPPTMAPCATSERPGFLEHPEQALNYYKKRGIGRVVCEEKHMGSRAVLVLCKDEAAALRRFGVEGERTGVCYTRTGRSFFNDNALEQAFLERVKNALTRAGFWERFQTDWVCLDAELMPWSLKAQALLRDQYAAVGAAAGAALPAVVQALELAASTENADVLPYLNKFRQKNDAVGRFVQAYRHYCWPVQSLDDMRLAPFHLLATEGQVHTDKDHAWHMTEIATVCAQDLGMLVATPYRVVDLEDPAQITSAIDWWLDLTASGGEGMVVKPLDFIARDTDGLVQPAVKCRGSEYLRIIYGPEYDLPEQLERLRNRGLGKKQSLALREFALGIEGLERFVRHEPLRAVHECVFGVLALESEPIDPRL